MRRKLSMMSERPSHPLTARIRPPSTQIRGDPGIRRAGRVAARVAAALFAAALLLPAGSSAIAAAADAAAAGARHDHALKHKKKKSASLLDTPFGREGDLRKVKRVVTIEMSDAMRYFPDQIRVKKGETVRFVARNSGELPHEMVLGTMDDLKKHAAMMKKNVEMDHDDPNVAHVEPGGTGAIVWHFTRAGEFYYGCLVPGHFDAGMIGTVVVR
jgi:uncharacterized cupredoxin-like copper-binding protein